MKKLNWNYVKADLLENLFTGAGWVASALVAFTVAALLWAIPGGMLFLSFFLLFLGVSLLVGYLINRYRDRKYGFGDRGWKP